MGQIYNFCRISGHVQYKSSKERLQHVRLRVLLSSSRGFVLEETCAFRRHQAGNPYFAKPLLMNFNIYNKHILGQQNFHSSTILTFYMTFNETICDVKQWALGEGFTLFHVDCAEAKLSKDFHFSTTCN